MNAPTDPRALERLTRELAGQVHFGVRLATARDLADVGLVGAASGQLAVLVAEPMAATDRAQVAELASRSGAMQLARDLAESALESLGPDLDDAAELAFVAIIQALERAGEAQRAEQTGARLGDAVSYWASDIAIALAATGVIDRAVHWARHARPGDESRRVAVALADAARQGGDAVAARAALDSVEWQGDETVRVEGAARYATLREDKKAARIVRPILKRIVAEEDWFAVNPDALVRAAIAGGLRSQANAFAAGWYGFSARDDASMQVFVQLGALFLHHDLAPPVASVGDVAEHIFAEVEQRLGERRDPADDGARAELVRARIATRSLDRALTHADAITSQATRLFAYTAIAAAR